ncbi:MAG TPA: hypothetical protein VNO34_00135 [Actinomycetota bacterium]|nr:hypothetical protein [Actinomycetota bacterium]
MARRPPGVERNAWSEAPAGSSCSWSWSPPRSRRRPDPSPWADPERVRGLVLGAGFGEPLVEELELTWRYPDSDRYWETLVDLSPALADLPSAAERRSVREALRERVAPFRVGAEYELPGVTFCVSTDASAS